MLSIKMLSLLFVLSVFTQNNAFADHHKKAEMGVNFANVKDGDTIKPNALVKFTVTGKEVKPAGQELKGTGHHHLIVDGTAVPLGDVVPADAQHLHFGKGQSEVQLSLKPGTHTLTLQFADGLHRSFGPEWSRTVKVKVK